MNRAVISVYRIGRYGEDRQIRPISPYRPQYGVGNDLYDHRLAAIEQTGWIEEWVDRGEFNAVVGYVIFAFHSLSVDYCLAELADPASWSVGIPAMAASLIPPRDMTSAEWREWHKSVRATFSVWEEWKKARLAEIASATIDEGAP